MKKLIFLVVLVLLFSACSKEPPLEIVPESSLPEVSESLPEEEPKKEPPEKIQTEVSEEVETDNGHENVAEQYDISKEKIDFAESILNDPESYNNEKLVISGNNGTKNIELLEDFISAVERNESAVVYGIMYGYTFPYYFELSYEPDGVVETIQYSPHRVYVGEYLRVYDTEMFYGFLGRGGKTTFSFPKMQLFWDEKPQYSEEEVLNMSLTPEKAKEKAEKILLSGNGHSVYLSEIGAEKALGSYGSVIPDDFSDRAEEYYKNLEPKYEGTFAIDGKPYHLIYFYEGEIEIGVQYYIGVENDVVFTVSMVDGGLVPVAYIPEPRIMFAR